MFCHNKLWPNIAIDCAGWRRLLAAIVQRLCYGRIESTGGRSHRYLPGEIVPSNSYAMHLNHLRDCARRRVVGVLQIGLVRLIVTWSGLDHGSSIASVPVGKSFSNND